MRHYLRVARALALVSVAGCAASVATVDVPGDSAAAVADIGTDSESRSDVAMDITPLDRPAASADVGTDVVAREDHPDGARPDAQDLDTGALDAPTDTADASDVVAGDVGLADACRCCGDWVDEAGVCFTLVGSSYPPPDVGRWCLYPERLAMMCPMSGPLAPPDLPA